MIKALDVAQRAEIEELERRGIYVGGVSSMPFLNSSDGARLYYEVYGEGEPIIFLGGIMMSTLSWASFVPPVSRKFRLILFDFRDQGQSSRMNEQYDLDIHVGDLLSLLDELGIPKIHMLGLSYGGQVALRFALSHQDRLKSLMLPNTTSFISSHLAEIGKAWEIAAELNDGEKFFQLAIPFVYSGTFYQSSLDLLRQRQGMFKTLLTKEWFEGFIRLSRSTRNYYTSPEELKTIMVPTLLIGAEEDILTPVRLMETIHESVKNCEFVIIPKAGHGAFLEKMNEFLSIIMGFVIKHS
ncbi:MAG: AB hydrolase superfamily protein YdjP [Chloroflexi bacterium]|nr:AB hydrolase superfamily protein YdjP [Chloroflexota bacterium]